MYTYYQMKTMWNKPFSSMVRKACVCVKEGSSINIKLKELGTWLFWEKIWLNGYLYSTNKN